MKKNQNDLSRRSFVKSSALVAGGIMMAPSVMASPNYSVKNKTLKLAVIGCGGRGTGAVSQALKADQDVQLVAMADAFQDRLDGCLTSLSKMFDDDRLAVKDKNKFVGFGSYKAAIDEADVVILTTPPGFRPKHFEYAVAQGKHIFMEKPVATSPAGVRQVLAAAKTAQANNLNVVVGLQRHYQTNYIETLKKLQAGDIGKIVSGQVYWDSSGVWVNPKEPQQTEMEHQMRNWYYFNWLCGDHILEQHIHNIDVANWYIGEHPIQAQGMGGRQVRTGKEYGEIFDHHFVEFNYASGAVISSQCRHQKGCMNRVSESFQGEKGNVYTDSSNAAWIKDYQGNMIYNHDGEEDKNPYQVEHDELFASIRSGGEINNAQYGAESTMTAIMGRMATYSGKVVKWDEALNSDLMVVPDEDTLTFDSVPPVVPNADGFYPIPMPGQTKVV
jgi:myo-inositol 2-dehydrogenase/D-chiro-inositol 1-dehydrogenase